MAKIVRFHEIGGPEVLKRRGLLASGADHVIVTDEEDLVSRVREIKAERALESSMIQSLGRCSTNWRIRPLPVRPSFSMAGSPVNRRRSL